MSKREFRVALSPLTERVFAGNVGSGTWVGKKRDVTQSFIDTVIQWLGEDGGERVVTTPDGDEWVITCERRKGRGS